MQSPADAGTSTACEASTPANSAAHTNTRSLRSFALNRVQEIGSYVSSLVAGARWHTDGVVLELLERAGGLGELARICVEGSGAVRPQSLGGREGRVMPATGSRACQTVSITAARRARAPQRLSKIMGGMR
jgi:hypothetical protein